MQRESLESKMFGDMTLYSLDLGSLIQVLTAVDGRDEEKFVAISTWLENNDVTEGSDGILELLATVQLNQLSQNFLQLQIDSNSPITNNPESLRKLLVEALRVASAQRDPSIFLLGPRDSRCSQTDILHFNPASGETRLVGEMAYREGATVVAVGGEKPV